MPNIEKRRNVWYATLHVPGDVRLQLGKSKLFQSLKTTDKRTAETRAAVVVAKWKAEIAQARGTSDPFLNEAMNWRRSVEQHDDKDLAESILLEHVETVVEPVKGFQTAKQFYDIASGQRRALALIVPEWKAGLQLAPKTIDQMVKDVGRMVAKFPTTEGLDRKSVRKWLEGLSTGPEQLSPSSIRRIVGFCRNFWRYLQETQEVSSDSESPFVVPSFAKESKRSKTSSKNGWIPFHPADVMKLHQKATEKKDHQLADLILIGAYTGARIEEICSIKVSDVGLDFLKITDSKTSAGVRTIPIHSALTDTVERLKKESTDGYLLSGLTFNKYDDRSNAVGKRFGRLKDASGYGEKQVFHSIRKTVVTLLENAGVSENLTADIVGHDKPRITYGLYSGGANLEVMREALEKIRYPKDSAK
jgi:integrase